MLELRLRAGKLKILCLGAHPDDIEIGCGATLLYLAGRRTIRADVVVLTGSAERESEAKDAAQVFLSGAEVDIRFGGLRDGRLPAQWGEVKDLLEDVARASRPDLIFAPRRDDAHQDHRLLAEVVPTVWRDVLVLAYEIPKWDGDLGRCTGYVAVSDEIARRKVELLNRCYPSQSSRAWWGDETFLGLMRLRGVESQHSYAEGFLLEKAVLSL